MYSKRAGTSKHGLDRPFADELRSIAAHKRARSIQVFETWSVSKDGVGTFIRRVSEGLAVEKAVPRFREAYMNRPTPTAKPAATTVEPSPTPSVVPADEPQAYMQLETLERMNEDSLRSIADAIEEAEREGPSPAIVALYRKYGRRV